MRAEKRRAPRFAIEQIVELAFGRERFVHATGINLSKTGLLCTTDDYLEPYSKISLMLSFPIGSKNHRFTCEGIVVRTEVKDGKYRAGINFNSLSKEDLRALTAFLNKRKTAVNAE